MMFGGHYRAWRRKRIRAIEAHYGRAWFCGKRVLELGCGRADIGAHFGRLDANVTVTDARPEHLFAAEKRHFEIQKFVLADLTKEWPFGDDWDLILDMGLIYHMPTLYIIQQHLHQVLVSCRHLVLESAVSRHGASRLEEGYDQSIYGLGYRPSEAQIEGCLQSHMWQYLKVADGRCNGGGHKYDWNEAQIDGELTSKHRRMWFGMRGL